jgi:cell division protein ZapA (FtsZ GTPase activity inhibitor)
MKAELKNYKVNILGAQYNFVSDETEDTVLQTITTVEKMVQEFAQANPLQSVHMIAILVALKATYHMNESQSAMLKQQTTHEFLIKYIDDALGSCMQK